MLSRCSHLKRPATRSAPAVITILLFAGFVTSSVKGVSARTPQDVARWDQRSLPLSSFHNLNQDDLESERRRFAREAADESTTTSTTTTTTTPKPEQQKMPPKLELEPDIETVTPNNTDPLKPPQLPPGFPPLGPPPDSLFPPPGLFPGPFGRPPHMPPSGPPPEFPDVCSNAWNFDPIPDESKKTKMEKQLAKMQCDFAMMQSKLAHFYQNLENELTELKKLNYNTVARLARLESLLRSSPY